MSNLCPCRGSVQEKYEVYQISVQLSRKVTKICSNGAWVGEKRLITDQLYAPQLPKNATHKLWVPKTENCSRRREIEFVLVEAKICLWPF